jgi:hypothetical protein
MTCLRLLSACPLCTGFECSETVRLLFSPYQTQILTYSPIDIIFVIYLYQRWIYRVDKNRVETADGEAGDSVDIAEIQAQQAADAASKSSESKKND